MLQISTSGENPGPSTQTRPMEQALTGPVSDELKENGGKDDDRNSTSNRWPPEETVALINIRSQMDDAFRDISPRAPLWEQVSRRLAELGYHRSAKKCKEKFENIYKYHRRTKEGRQGQSNGKTYRFFEKLESLDTHRILRPPSSEHNQKQMMDTEKSTPPIELPNVIEDAIPCSIRFPSASRVDHSSSTTSTSSEDSDQGIVKKKRKLKEFLDRLMKKVIDKQENLEKQFIEVLEKCERDRMAREEAWKMQELARIERERELLAQERSIAAAKDAALLAFLKEFTEQAGQVQLPETILIQNQISDDKDKEKLTNCNGGSVVDMVECTNGGNSVQIGSSRWPKDEVEALIGLRTNLELQCQGNGLKGPLWEEISSAMKRLGYDRSAKRCKEKWENINKYFKRMKERNKGRPEDSKTCPYYQLLDALYSKRPKVDELAGSGNQLRQRSLHIICGQEENQQLE